MSLPNSRPLDNSCELNRMVKRLYTSPNKGFIEVGPCNVFMINNFEQVYDGIKNLTVYDDDVFLLGFPKSGTRWTQEMVWLICNDFDYEGAKETILTRRFPTLEFDGVTHYNINITKTISEMKRPRLLKTHLPWSLCPDDITSYSKKPKFIVVTRTPEDVCLSMFYHARTSQGFTGSFEEFCILFLAGKVMFGSYWSQVLSVWEQRDKHKMLFIRYEDMKEDLAAVIRQVAEFLGKNVPEEEMPRLVRHLSFDSLKVNPAFNNADLIAKFNGHCNPFVREGIVGGHKTAMTSEMIERFKIMKRKMFGDAGLCFD